MSPSRPKGQAKLGTPAASTGPWGVARAKASRSARARTAAGVERARAASAQAIPGASVGSGSVVEKRTRTLRRRSAPGARASASPGAKPSQATWVAERTPSWAS